MRIVLIGAGNVATVLGRKITEADHDVVQVIARHEATAAQLAQLLNARRYTTDLQAVATTADLYVLAAGDGAIAAIAAQLRLNKKLVVHTAGSVPKAVLHPVSVNYGVLYPLQSLRKEMTTLPHIPFLVDGNTPDDTALIGDFARTLSDQVQTAGDEQRLRLHVAAVMASNFTNHLYALAQAYCRQEQVDFTMLLPLINEVAHRLYELTPQHSQTGPAIRHDEETIQKHLQLLQEHPVLKAFYQLFTQSIQNMYPVV